LRSCYDINMLTTSSVIEQLILSTPFLEEGLANDIINLSALARVFRPQVEKETMKPISQAALVMALKRLQPKLKKKPSPVTQVIKELGDITVRSRLSEFTFQSSQTILDCQKKLLACAQEKPGLFITFTQGVYENTVFVSSALAEDVKKCFSTEKLIARHDGLCAAVLRLPNSSRHVPGIYYAILKQLAWDGINVEEIVSTLTEFTLIFEHDQADRAFARLKALIG
jgi:hypothetical protein